MIKSLQSLVSGNFIVKSGIQGVFNVIAYDSKNRLVFQ